MLAKTILLLLLGGDTIQYDKTGNLIWKNKMKTETLTHTHQQPTATHLTHNHSTSSGGLFFFVQRYIWIESHCYLLVFVDACMSVCVSESKSVWLLDLCSMISLASGLSNVTAEVTFCFIITVVAFCRNSRTYGMVITVIWCVCACVCA